MKQIRKNVIRGGFSLMAMLAPLLALADDFQALQLEVQQHYDSELKDLFEHFHANPELSFVEFESAASIAKRLEAVGFEVHTGIAQTGVVALLRNGEGPLVMMRADMDALPVKELTKLP